MTSSLDRELPSRDGRTWPIGTADQVHWIQDGTESGLAITAAIPPVFEAYATVVLPDPNADDQQERERHDRALVAMLKQHAASQSWWLGYLDTGVHDVIFPDARTVTLYADWRYVLIDAGPDQAATWRERDPWRGVLPDLMFPADRSWLISTLWDDDWTCVGGPAALIEGLVHDPDLGRRSRRVALSDPDVTPAGHVAR